jgi:hypothetical protein
MKCLAEALQMYMVDLTASIHEPADFGGYPTPNGERMRFLPPEWAYVLAQKGKGILFLDEVSCAPPAVQAALLKVVLERKVGDLYMPETIVPVAAANPPEEAAAGWDMSPPMANRWLHLYPKLDAAEWAQGIVTGFPNPDIYRLPENWEAHKPKFLGLGAGFCRTRITSLYKKPDDETSAGKAWPSPRTWEMLCILLAALESLGPDPDCANELAAGSIGEGMAIEFFHWVDEQDLPDPEELLKNPVKSHFPERGDRLFAATGAVVSAIAGNTTLERWAKGWKVLKIASEIQLDVAAAVARGLAKMRPEGAKAPKEALVFKDILDAVAGG